MTYLDLVRLPEDGNRHEIIDGEWYMTPPPTTDHQLVVAKIIYLLSAHVRPRKLGGVMVGPGVYFGRHDCVEPDVVYLLARRKALRKRAYIRGGPDLVVEVLSPTTESVDRGRKLPLYRDRGVSEYWIVNTANRTGEVYEFGPLRKRSVFQEGQTFKSAAVKDLQVDVDEIFSVLE